MSTNGRTFSSTNEQSVDLSNDESKVSKTTIRTSGNSDAILSEWTTETFNRALGRAKRHAADDGNESIATVKTARTIDEPSNFKHSSIPTNDNSKRTVGRGRSIDICWILILQYSIAIILYVIARVTFREMSNVAQFTFATTTAIATTVIGTWNGRYCSAKSSLIDRINSKE